MDYSGIEKRRFIRARFPCKIFIHPPHQHIISTYTENISAGGVRVIIEEHLDISTPVGLEVHMKDGVVHCKGRIVWVVGKESPYRKGVTYSDTGIEFYEISESDRVLIKEFIDSIVETQK
ncbi:MAG: PilZ domain-containing protein [Candidatus Omnitrophota bacterium]